jgi:uncharacterized protein involved in exopolysaccharide biosynthesis
MTPPPIEEYLARLERALRTRGIEPARMVDEAREHLVDAIELRRQRGLSLEDAVQEAIDSFGAPEIVAAHVILEEDSPMNRLAAALDGMWQRKWWIIAPTLATALVTAALTPHLLPTRYRSESTILVVSSRAPADDARAVDPALARFQQISQTILSRSHLERIISDFKLYETDRETAPLGDIVLRMRRDISVNLLTSAADGRNAFSVSFVSPDPKLAQSITARLASLFIEENLRESRTTPDRDSRQTGEQYRIVDPARLPEQPDGPSRLGFSAAGTLAGFGLGLAAVGVRSRFKRRSA